MIIRSEHGQNVQLAAMLTAARGLIHQVFTTAAMHYTTPGGCERFGGAFDEGRLYRCQSRSVVWVFECKRRTTSFATLRLSICTAQNGL